LPGPVAVDFLADFFIGDVLQAGAAAQLGADALPRGWELLGRAAFGLIVTSTSVPGANGTPAMRTWPRSSTVAEVS
jgi:hypothetical protein